MSLFHIFTMPQLKLQTFLITLVVITPLVLGLAIPEVKATNKHHSRILKKQLSKEEHYKDIAKDVHGTGQHHQQEHNRDYDHEAFLGSEDEADEFDQLTPEESRARLATIVERIDSNKDGNITEVELKRWIYQSQRKYLLEDVERQWAANTFNDPAVLRIEWVDFYNRTYGFLEEIASANIATAGKDGPSRAPEDMKTYHEMAKRDERRWKQADQDNDNAMSKEEFALFLHPEEDSRMFSVVIEETLEDIDRDKDGRISEAEYIADLYAPEDGQAQYVPEWVTREREQFHLYRDKNKDGYLDRQEIKEWIVPTDYDHAEAEAKHLIYEADTNKDGVLSKEEILDNYDVFVGSQATDFGEALTKHDEF